MARNKIKETLVSAVAFSLIACTSTVPNNFNGPAQLKNSPDLDKEYPFSSKELTYSYLKRKIDSWLTDPVNGPGLVKEIAYARLKHPELFCSILMEDNHNRLDLVNQVQAVQERKSIDQPFSNFLEGCPSGATQQNEFRINTTTNNSQAFPAVAMDDDGDFVAVWVSYYQDGDGYGVYARRYDSAGEPLGSEFQVNTYTTHNQENPAVAMNSTGDFVITWSREDGDYDGIFGQRFYSDGTTNGNEFQVNTMTSQYQILSSVAMDNNGDFVIAWNSYVTGGYGWEIYARRYDPAGTPSGTEFLVNTYTSGSQSGPSVAMNAGGDFVIAWDSYLQDGSSSGIFGQRFNNDGTTNGNEFQVNTFTENNQFHASAAMDNAGDFVISWTGPDGYSQGIFARRYYNGGITGSSEFQVNTYSTQQQSYSEVAMDAAGDFVIAWQSYTEDSSGFGSYVRRYTSDGEPAGSVFLANSFTSNNQASPKVAMDAQGDFVVVWQSYYQEGYENGGNEYYGYYGIYAQRYNNSGTAI
jgi:hypothetical protein